MTIHQRLDHGGRLTSGCLHEQFEHQAESRPDAVAVQFEGKSLSYGELNQRANRLAHRLRTLGVGPDTLVAMCLERSLEMVVAILGVLKAGGAYVPIDPEYPPERLAFVLSDCEAPVLITQERLLERLPDADAVVLCLDRDAAVLEGEASENPDRLAAPDNLAYVIYTSGSTGKPKGVMVEHGNVTRLFSATDAWFHPSESDVWTLFHSYAFDFSVWELWGALLHGGRLVVVSQWVTRSPEAFATLLVDQQVTVLNATPSLFLAAMDELLSRSDRLSLRVVVFGGEALLPRLLSPWFERFGDQHPQLVNMYGITETTVHVTYRPVVAADVGRDGSPIGEPIPDLDLYLLDEGMNEIGDDVVGELFVGGPGVARGYLHRPELTAERFLPNPFGPGLLYRTGDRARRQPGQGFWYEGRIDDQVKVRGFRIELGEIETALTRHPQIAAAVVVARGQGSEAELAAYAVPRDSEVAGHELRQFLAHSLPAHMVPSTVTTLPALPLTPNGKVDRKALPEPVRERSEERTLQAPRTELERRLVAIWERELGMHPIGITDDFFDLGVTSIVAAQLFAKIELELGDKLPLGAIYRAPTIENLAALVAAGDQQSRWTSLVPIKPNGSRPPIFCFHAGPGDVLHFARLARHLHPEQPVYGLQARGLYGDAPPITTIAEMADHYLSEMRQVWSDGPWRLAGLCIGGLTAYEVAQRVSADGEEVELMALLNAPSPLWVRQWGWYGYQPTHLARRPKVRRLTRRQRLRRAFRQPRRFWTAFVHYYHQATEPHKARLAHALGRGIPDSARADYFHKIAVEAQRSYDARPYDGEVLLLHGNGLFEDSSLGWTELATGGLETQVVPGDHTAVRQMMMEPAVEYVSARLEEYLERAEPARRGQHQTADPSLK